jgi:hypothetical protein
VGLALLSTLLREAQRHIFLEQNGFVDPDLEVAHFSDDLAIDSMLRRTLHLALSLRNIPVDLMKQTFHLILSVMNSGRWIDIDDELFAFLTAHCDGDIASLLMELSPGIQRAISACIADPSRKPRARFDLFLKLFDSFSIGKSERELQTFLSLVIGDAWPSGFLQDLLLLVHGAHPAPSALFAQLHSLASCESSDS